MSNINGLPDNWITVKVSDIGTSITGNTPSTQNPENYGTSIPYIKPPQLIDRHIDSSKEYLSEKGGKLARLLPPFSVLVSCIGNLGKTGLNKIPVAFNQQINAIIPFKGVSSSYLFYQAQSHSFRTQLESKATATTISIVNKGNFETVELNLAPFSEQQRIVAKIEELFSELDKGIENLKTAQAQLKIYRQALLKHAFEGKLTAQWRAENQDQLKTAEALLKRIQHERTQSYQQQLTDWETSGKQGSKPKAPKPLSPLTAEELNELPELPKGWGWFAIGDICLESILGKMLDKKKNKGELKPYLRNINVRWGRFALDDLLEMRFEESEYVRFGLVDGDLVICEGGEPGRCAVWRKELGQDMQIQKALHRVRFTNSINSSFVQMYFELCSSNRRLEKMFTGTTIKHLTGEKLARMALPICAIDEQLQIMLALESKFSEIEQLEQTLATSLQQTEALRQSILKKAFSGQLVPQDPRDEPASALLARIRTEREQANSPKRERKSA
jgi:type I restriction enzyme S subunit